MNETWIDEPRTMLWDLWNVMGWPSWLRRVYVLSFPLSLLCRLCLAAFLVLGVIIPLVLAETLWRAWLQPAWQGERGYEGWPVSVRRGYVLIFPIAGPIHLILLLAFLLALGAILGVRDWLWPEILKPIWTGVLPEHEGEEYFE